MDGWKLIKQLLLELQSVGQDEAALQALHEVILSKRSRSNPITVMEPIMLKYVELCVELKKGKMVKEGLHQYRNIAQNTSVNSIEVLHQFNSTHSTFTLIILI